MADKLIGIQIGAVSFQDEGVGAVLDTVQQRAGVNAVFLATPTWNRATGGRARPGFVPPDHGSTQPDPEWLGGNYATVHPQFYGNTVLGGAGRAPEYPGWDMLADVIPQAKARGIKAFAYFDESSHARHLRSYPNFLKCLEVDIWNKPGRRPCFNNPDYRNWVLGVVEDYVKSYPLDGLMFSSARPGPLDRLIQEPTRQGLGLAVCYCEHCKAKAAERGVDWRRAQEGYRKLVLWNAAISEGKRPADGAFVTFWRLLLTYPELLSWQSLWADGQHQLYRDMIGTVRAYRPDMKVGWDLYHNLSFSPFYRAGQNFADLSHIADFIKVSTYHTSAGPRFFTFVNAISKAIFGDAEPAFVYPLLLKMLGLEEGPLADLPTTGFSADSVRREVQRAVIGSEGRGMIYAGIDVDIPVGQPAEVGSPPPNPGDLSMIDGDITTGPDLIKTTPERVTAAVLAAFEGGAQGIVLSRKYAEMRLDNLSGVGAALAQMA
ncbi:MAG: hypothetical protein JWP26_715 [Devosia sp.]|uniref:hypothetical protein n=1 Tax=Devosia sp. TaxID=1871048 RepID=UPI00260AEBBC|nr:hypothetical protein [Devosia sp.]MDB5585745.1 hypothetical protein [Devosia sp.]